MSVEKRALRPLGIAVGACAAWLGLALPAQAQFVNGTVIDVGNQQICPGGNNNGDAATNPQGFSTKNITVSGRPGNAAGMRVGLVAAHAYRGDIRMDMRKQGTATWRTIVASSNEANNNYNVLLDRTAAEALNTGTNGGDHDFNIPFYQFRANPGTALNNFNTTAANGTWEFRFCDADYRDSGQVGTVEIMFEDYGDLAVNVSLDAPATTAGGTVVATYTLSNLGRFAQSNISVLIDQQGDVTTTNSTPSAGSFNGSVWTVPSLANGATATLTVTTTVASGVVDYTATITARGLTDPNANNDTDSESAAVQTSTANPPPLTCSKGEVYAMNWTTAGTNSWTGNSLSNSYNAADTDPATTDIPLTLTMGAPGTGAGYSPYDKTTYASPAGFLSGAITPPSPESRVGWDGATGGAASVYVGLDFPDQAPTSKVLMNMELGIPAEGVEGFQFTITDIDQGSYRDRITVLGRANGVDVPVSSLTPWSGLVLVTGNSAAATANAGNRAATEGGGNLTVTFNQPVDQIVFVYDNHPNAAANPGPQAIALQDLSICRRLLPDVEATKSVEVFDPANQGLFMTPGNEVAYTIEVQNKGPNLSGTAESLARDLDVSDTLPNNLRFVSATASGFTGGSFTTIPAANTDCEGGACVVSYAGGDLDVDAVGQINIRALIK